jgi:poly(3-hydroxybutyrate) depolymerase
MKLLVLLALLSTTVFAQEKIYVPKSATVPRGHIVTLPQGYTKDGPGYPLIIFLHGDGERGNQLADGLKTVERTGLPQVMLGSYWDKTLPFIVVAPQLFPKDQNGGDWYAVRVKEVYDMALKLYNVDTSRVYLTGLSLGGMGTWNALNDSYFKDKIAATLVSSTSGTIKPENCASVINAGHWNFYGTTDTYWPLINSQNGVNSYNKCFPFRPAALTLMSGNHSSTVWNKVYENRHNALHIGADGVNYSNIYHWLLSHRIDNGVSLSAAHSAFVGGSVTTSLNPIEGTEDDATYQTYRYRPFTASVPLANGVYKVTLKFAETWASAVGKRVFHVDIEDKRVLTDLDVFAEVGKNKALDKTFTVTVNDGVMNFKFSKGTLLLNEPMVSAIVITR